MNATTSNRSSGSHAGFPLWALVTASASFSELVRGRLDSRRGDHGATAVEYAFMVGLIAIVIVGAVTIFGRNLVHLYEVPSSVFRP